ncbi:MAG TPA: hypothetical protein VM659_28620 [Dongiaceae bacterium]|nr:hypothetical protein [Dongiaceae bacterium]
MNKKFANAAVVKSEGLGDRQIRARASDATVDMVGDILIPKGCSLRGNTQTVKVFADHESKIANTLGSAEVTITDKSVDAVITFLEKGISPLADLACELYKSGVLTDVSVGFDPEEAEPRRGGGIIFTKWKFLELSCVGIGCNENAVTTAKSAGHEGAHFWLEADEHMTREAIARAGEVLKAWLADPSTPLVLDKGLHLKSTIATKADETDWRVGASGDLPLGDDGTWDGPAAAKKMLDDAAGEDGTIDVDKAKRGFLVYDLKNATERGGYKLPFAELIDGELKAMPGGLRAAASRLSGTDIPDAAKEKARSVIDSYEAKMKNDKAIAEIKTKLLDRFKTKGLYDVAQLACLLDQLGWLQYCAEDEAEWEGDDSLVPGMLANLLQAGAEALMAMAKEETDEALAIALRKTVAQIRTKEAITKRAKKIA